MYLSGIIVFGTNIVVTIVVIVAAVLLWRAGYFKDIEEPKYRMMDDDKD